VVMVLGQLFAIFGLHFVFSYFPKLIHQHSKPLVHFIGQNIQKSGYVKDKIRLSFSYFAFHTKNRYGKTYGSFGLITLNSFAKVKKPQNVKSYLKNNYLYVY